MKNYMKIFIFFVSILMPTIQFAFAQLNTCPSGLVNYSLAYSSDGNESCGLQTGLPTCSKEGWIISPNLLSCTPPKEISESAICKNGEVLGRLWWSTPRCIKPYIEIQNGNAVPSIFDECLQNRWYEDHFSSPFELCKTYVQQTLGNQNTEKIKECVLSGRYDSVPAQPRLYCQMRAQEFWNRPANNTLDSVWLPR